MDSNGDGSGSGGDFLLSSHHITGTVPTEADCEVCHDQGAHPNQYVRLKDADTGAVYILDGVNDALDYDNFCLSCHDGNGAQAEATPLTPFSDGLNPPTVDVAAWGSSSHGAAPVAGCVDCHDNGHGSNKTKLLAPWDFVDDGDPDDGMMQEERFCYDCHSSAGYAKSNVSTFDVAGLFAQSVTSWPGHGDGIQGSQLMNDRHDVALTLQNISGAKIECVNCHDVHADNSTLKVIADPDPNDGRVPGDIYYVDALDSSSVNNFMSDWCLECHDGTMPAGVVEGHAPSGGLTNVDATMSVSSHSAASRSPKSELVAGYGYKFGFMVQCLDCHVRHLSDPSPVSSVPNNFHLKSPLRTADDSADIVSSVSGTINYDMTVLGGGTNVNGYDWCNSCHQNSMGNKKSDCTHCHQHGETKF